MGAVLRRAIYRVSTTPWFARVLDQLETWSARERDTLAVLTYHRVDTPAANPSLYRGTLSATPDEFATQIDVLGRHCEFVSLHDVLSALHGARLPPRALLVTFDDAYRDFFDHAWPVLRRHGVPATLFVATAYPGNPHRCFWWDRLAHRVATWPPGKPLQDPHGVYQLDSERDRIEAVKRLRDHVKSLPHDEAMEFVDRFCADHSAGAQLEDNHVLDWNRLRQLSNEGVTLAAHTQTHPLVHRVSLSAARQEVVGSMEDLRREIGSVPPVFAYPSGGFSADVVAMLRDAGVELAFSTCRGLNHWGACDPLTLRRIGVGRRTNSALVRAQLLPGIDRFISLFPVRSSV